jgi:hypothetical protein
MKRPLDYSLLCATWLAVGQLGVLGAEEQSNSSEPRAGREAMVAVEVTAKVTAIDLATREVSLKGPLGNTVTFTVDQRVKRLDEVKVGDLVHADYYISFAAELRKPTPDEESHPIVQLEGAAKAPPGTSPAAGGLRRFKVVTTVEGLDRPTQTITVKGPRGNYLTARVADPSRLSQVRIGENIVLTYTEALAISLEKAQPKAPE